jgi:hypothetical protein
MLTGKQIRFSSFVLLLGLCAAVATEAQASKNRPVQRRLGGIVMQNPTSNTIYFDMRLGYEDVWTEYEVLPGNDLQIWFELDPDGTVPVPNVRFDRIGGDANLTFQEYELEFYEVAYEDDMTGFRYEFQYGPSGKTLDLYSID